MRVLFCKIQCPSFICFCKPSPHIYTPGPLKLENSPHVPSKVESVPESDEASAQLSSEAIEVKQELRDGQHQPSDNCRRKSNLRNPNSDSVASKKEQKKKVQWMDYLGKELAEIREFESSEIEDTDNDGEDNRGCVCTIL